MSVSPSRLLVTGASGQLGRRVIELLLEAETPNLIAASRDPAKLADLAVRGVETRRADFDDPASLAVAFAGVDRLLLVSTDALNQPGRRIAQHRAAVAAAAAAGVKHVVYTSAPGARPQVDGGVIDDHFWTEQALAASAIPGWTILRHNLYAELLLMGAGQAVASGALYSATAGAGRAYVSREDCARIDAAALRQGEGRKILDVSGPAAVTQDEVAALYSQLSGKPVTHHALSPDALRQGLLAASLPPSLVAVLVDFDVAAAEGQHAIVTDAVEALTGQPPVSVAAFLEAHRAAFS
ncbi:NAD(P)H-binding protein [Caulobacter sp. UNC279MFTsu5.1]|uniref:NAD(P)H-binding protein n=1 Tax=Caulobacter sp. UNC279MFTsu5.1 TaxID=1502775 RepID=UPI0008EDCCA0|nr:NAD(P)H-binding protein [Caulobacter sp. UNC279MFTsu5.1]SFK50404.1 NAD(P)H dehydrogenase (quinone) [Caulobacter sp. UNC279MFTsu5.1]